MNLRAHKWKWISSIIVLLGLVSSIVFYRSEQAYAEAIKNAKEAVELEDYDSAYQSISEKKPKTADELLFKKIKLIKFSKLNLASDYDLSPPLGGKPDFEWIMNNLFNGIISIDVNDYKRAEELNVTKELLDVRRQYLDQLDSIFWLSEYEVDNILAMTDEERDKKIKEIYVRGDEVLEENLKKILRKRN